MGLMMATLTAVRESNTTAYASTPEAWSNDDTSPTQYLISDLANVAGWITDVVISSTNDPATLLQAEIWLFDGEPALVNDNAAWALSDADVLKVVGKIPFTLASTMDGGDTNSIALPSGLNIGFDCRNKPGLYARIKTLNAYTPASAETLTFRFKVATGNVYS